MNRVLIVGKLTRDPETRSLASGATVTTFTVAVEALDDDGRSEYVPVLCWAGLAMATGRVLSKRDRVGLTGSIRTRSWDDDRGVRHWKTEVVADHVELYGSARSRDALAAAIRESSDALAPTGGAA